MVQGRKVREGKAILKGKKTQSCRMEESHVLSCHLSSAMVENHISSSFSGSMCNFPTLNPRVLSGDTLS